MDDCTKFTVAYDDARHRLSWVMRGFWNLADVAAFRGAIRAALAHLGAPPLHYACLSDSREFPVQSRDVAEALSAIQRVGVASRVGPTAIVVGSMMNKLQAQRALGPDVRIFMSLTDAEEWLDGRAP